MIRHNHGGDEGLKQPLPPRLGEEREYRAEPERAEKLLDLETINRDGRRTFVGRDRKRLAVGAIERLARSQTLPNGQSSAATAAAGGAVGAGGSSTGSCGSKAATIAEAVAVWWLDRGSL